MKWMRWLVMVGMGLCCASLHGAGDGAATQAVMERGVRADGVIVAEGKPFFPVGIYHDSLDAGYYGQKFLRDLDVIADAGFNIVHVSMDFSQDDTAAKAAELAKKRGMYLAVSVYLKGVEGAVKEQAKCPAILISTLGDDFNSDAKGTLKGPPKYPPGKLREYAAEVKKISPGLLTYSSGSAYKGASMEGYGTALDLIAVQCYPIGDGSQSAKNELEAMDDVVANYWKLAGPEANKALIVNPQVFAYTGHRWPTPEEMRLQAWISLLDGAKGLIWYSYLSYDKKKKALPEANPEAWKELKLLVPELKERAEFFTEGKLLRIENAMDAAFDDGAGTWHAGTWTVGKKMLVVAINTHRTKAVEVNLEVGGEGKVVRRLEAARYPANLVWAEGQWKGKLAPASVEVLEIGE